MRSHIVTGGIATALAIAGAFGVQKATQPAPVIESHIERQVQTTAKYSWGALSYDEQLAIAGWLSDGLKGVKVEIFCGGAWCADLAEDFDDVMDHAGADSAVERPMIDMADDHGKPIAAIGIWPRDDRTSAFAQAVRDATSGRIDMQVVDPPSPQTHDGIVISIGHARRK